jgi:hypothetical protein
MGVEKATEVVKKSGKFALYSGIASAALFLLGIILGAF